MPSNQPTVTPVAHTSADPTAEIKDNLRSVLPQFFAEDQFDVERLCAFLGRFADDRPERYSFTWAGKRDAIRLIQAPIAGALIPDKNASVNWENTQHVFISGDNFPVLRLLYKAYYNRVKMIYIDPPYNTGNDFIYPDDYSAPLNPYLLMLNDMDAFRNWKTNRVDRTGRFHSEWLSVMYPRLFVAQQLLREDGVIFVSIDDAEVHNLRLLMDQVFGPENFVATIIWEKKYSPQNDARWFSENHDYILLYARNKEIWRPNLLARTEEANARYHNPDNDPRGPWKSADLSVRTYTPSTVYPITTPSGRVVNPPEGRCWVVSRKRFEELVEDNRIWFGPEGNNVPAFKKFLSEVKQGITPLTIWGRDEVGDNQAARRTIRDLFGDTRVFDTPKPVDLVKRMLALSTSPEEEDIVLDFFAGSSTTAHAVLEQNLEDHGHRRFIMVQVPEEANISGFSSVADIGIERIRRAITHLHSDSSPQVTSPAEATQTPAGVKVFRLAGSNFRQWQGVAAPTPDDYTHQMSLFTDPLVEGWQLENVIYEITLAKGIDLNCSITRLSTVTSNTVFVVQSTHSNQSFLICLDSELSPTLASDLALDSKTNFICRDTALTDELAANLALQCHLEII